MRAPLGRWHMCGCWSRWWAPHVLGDAGDVVVNNRNGRISTAGSYSIGVVAQSVGGGGGRVGRANGSMTLHEIPSTILKLV